MKEALLESTLRKMRLARVLPSIQAFSNPSVLDIGCGWEARLLHEIEPYIARGVGIDFKAPEIRTEKLHTFSYFFEAKEKGALDSSLAKTGGGGESCKNSASGNHCTDFTDFERTADLKSGSLSKSVKNSTSNTANPRILEENQASLSSRAAQSGVAIHSPNTQNLDSSVLAESTKEKPTPPPHKLCHLPFPNESFEIITMLAVLEHLHHPQAMLEEIARVLKPDGILLLTVPSHLAKPVLEFLAFRLKIVSEAEIRDHKRYYNKRDLRELVAFVPELTLTKHTYFQLGMNNFCIIHKRA